MIAIFFGTVAVNAMNDYTGSLSLQAAGLGLAAGLGGRRRGPQLPRTLYLYYNNFSSTFENYLLVITYWIGPWAGDRADRLAPRGDRHRRQPGRRILGCFRAASTPWSRWSWASSSRSRS